MLSESQVISYLSGKETSDKCKIIEVWRGVYYRMSLHIDGACPAFYSLRYNARKRTYLPDNKQTLPNNYFGVPYQEIFDAYLFSRHPREPEVLRQYRMSQYKPFTQAPFIKVIDVITGAIFQDSGYVLKIANKDDAAYIDGNNFKGKPLVDYVSSMFNNIASDPNGFFATIPKKRRDEYGQNERITFDIPYICSKHIIHISEDEIIFEYDGYRWNINKVGYFRYVEQGNTFVNVDGDIGGYYAHMLDRLPIVIGGGRWNAQGFYDSWLMAARAYADDFVAVKSAEQLVDKEASHPYIIEADTECPECNGLRTVEVPCKDCEGVSCECRGSGRLSSPCGGCGASGRVSRNPGERMIVPQEQMGNNLVQIINPDVKVNELHLKKTDVIFKAMLAALHLDMIDEAQSGEAKKMDMQTRHQFLSAISKDCFNRLLFNMVRDILSMRNTTVNNGNVVPEINPEFALIPPTQFDIKTSYDLAEEYKLATESKLPSYVRTEINDAFIDKQFGGNEVLACKSEYIQLLDPFSIDTPDELQIWALNGACSPRELKFHTHLPNILDNIIREWSADAFVSATFEKVKAEVDARFNKIAPDSPFRGDISERIDV